MLKAEPHDGQCQEGAERDWPPWQGFAEDVCKDIDNNVDYLSEAEYSDTQSAWEEQKEYVAAPSTPIESDGWEPGGWYGDDDFTADSWADDGWEDDGGWHM